MIQELEQRGGPRLLHRRAGLRGALLRGGRFRGRAVEARYRGEVSPFLFCQRPHDLEEASCRSHKRVPLSAGGLHAETPLCRQTRYRSQGPFNAHALASEMSRLSCTPCAAVAGVFFLPLFLSFVRSCTTPSMMASGRGGHPGI